MKNKIFAQKAYEKMEMVKRNPNLIKAMLASNSEGQSCIVLAVDTTPIAIILQEPNDLEPNYEKSEAIQQLFNIASSQDKRVSPDEFDKKEIPIVRQIFACLTEVWDKYSDVSGAFLPQEFFHEVIK